MTGKASSYQKITYTFIPKVLFETTEVWESRGRPANPGLPGKWPSNGACAH